MISLWHDSPSTQQQFNLTTIQLFFMLNEQSLIDFFEGPDWQDTESKRWRALFQLFWKPCTMEHVNSRKVKKWTLLVLGFMLLQTRHNKAYAAEYDFFFEMPSAWRQQQIRICVKTRSNNKCIRRGEIFSQKDNITACAPLFCLHVIFLRVFFSRQTTCS